MSEADVALLAAAGRGDVGTIERLLDSGGDPNATSQYGNTALYNACFADRVMSVRALLSRHADPNLRMTYHSPVDGRVEPGIVALMVCRSVDTIDLLLQAGADPNVGDVSGCTPLMRAALAATPAAVARLLTAGADPTAKDSAGRTAADRVRARLDWLSEHWNTLAQPAATNRRAELERMLALLEPTDEEPTRPGTS